MKEIAIILGSCRKSGNTSNCAEQLSKELNLPTKIYNLLDYDISYFDYQHLNMEDGFIKLCEELAEYSDLVFATPVYWYSMSAPMKTFFDRTTDLITIRKDLGRSLKGKKTWLLASGTDKTLPQGFEVPFKLTSKYFDMNYSGSLFCPMQKGAEKKGISDKTKRKMKDFAKELATD